MKPAQYQYQYKIGTGKGPMIAALCLAAVFGGLAVWLYKTENEAFPFLALMFGFTFAVFPLVVYRFLVYKVLIGAEGFYYQTQIGNGRYYSYAEVKRAWTSSGRDQNGIEQDYCNLSLKNGSVIRFLFYGTDEEAVDYLIRQADASRAGQLAEEESCRMSYQMSYRIDGKYLGRVRVAGGLFIAALMILLDGVVLREAGFDGAARIWMLVPSGLMGVLLCLFLLVNYRSFRVLIEKDGFYCQTNPFNGKYYAYRDIVSCREIEKVRRNHRHGAAVGAAYFFFFEFTDVRGKTRRFLFEKPVYEHEINVLKERIRGETR